MTYKKNSPSAEGAKVKHYSVQCIQKTKDGQTKGAAWLKLVFLDTGRILYLPSSKEARSLLLLYRSESGLTRKEALERHFILSLTQHVAFMRHDLDLNIWTERVGPRRYARYHLITPLKITVYE